MKAMIEAYQDDLYCHCEPPSTELRLSKEIITPLLTQWAARYAEALKKTNPAGLLAALGREMFDTLDSKNTGGTPWASQWIKKEGARELEIRVHQTCNDDAFNQALFSAPWELLANDKGHLADDPVHLFEIWRRVGGDAEPLAAKYRDLFLLFMAAAPKGGAAELDFEAEENAILEATKRTRLRLLVEETGNVEQLGIRLKNSGSFQAVHLSCHGGFDDSQEPVLVLEDNFGGRDTVNAGQLNYALGDAATKPPLVFLSACHTAERPDGNGGLSESLARKLLGAGVANVLGWDGSVYDDDASKFASFFYEELSRNQTIVHAAAWARQRLREEQLADRKKGTHWHLSRLYLGTGGGGSLVSGNGEIRKPMNRGEYFLDSERKEVPVAGSSEFVGRRRNIQHILQEFREGRRAVLIHGMGCLGKSSLAKRICDRMVDLKPVVIFGKYDALSVFDAVIRAVPAETREDAAQQWRERIAKNHALLAHALEDMLCNFLDKHPILLVVDDLERILEKPTAASTVVQVAPGYRDVLSAILSAFRDTDSDSRLLMTSRYVFRLEDGQGRELTDNAHMACEQLPPMTFPDRRKQFRMLARDTEWEEKDGAAETLHKAIEVAGGNPGLQDILTTPIVSGEIALARDAIDKIERYRSGDALPEEIAKDTDHDNAVGRFFRRIALDTYREALTPKQATMLRASLIFSPGIPVSQPVLEAVGRAANVPSPAVEIQRLVNLGLLDRWVEEDGTHVSVNSLMRPLFDPPSDEELAEYAGVAVPLLAKEWSTDSGNIVRDERGVELARLALSTRELAPELLNRIAITATRYLHEQCYDPKSAYQHVSRPAILRLRKAGQHIDAGLLLVHGQCAQRLGELDEAMESFAQANSGFKEKGDDLHSETIALGGMADILFRRGDLEEALRIRTEEQLPVYERLGDVRSLAVTKGKIADILFSRGDLEEALSIRMEDELPVYERLGDVRSLAVTKGQIADILFRRGDLEEALRICTEEQLPVYEFVSLQSPKVR